MEGQDVTLRPFTCSASIRVQRPWQSAVRKACDRDNDAENETGVTPCYLAARLGLSSVPVHLGEPHRQTHFFFSRAVCGTSSTMP